MKRTICIFVVLCISLLPAISLADNKGNSYSIEQAQKTAIENSKQLALDDIDIQNKQTALDNSKYDILPESGDSLDNAYKSDIKPIEVETNLEVAKRTRANDENVIKLDVYKSALDILLAQKQLDTEKQKLDILTEKLNMAKAKLDQDMITQNDLDDAQYSLDSKSIDVEKAQDNLDSMVLNFKKLLNLPLDDSPVTLTDSLTYEPLQSMDIDSIVTKAESTNKDVYEKSQIVKEKEDYLSDLVKYRGQGTTNYFDGQYDLESAKIDLDDSQNTLEVNIRNKYNDLLNSSDKLALAEKYESLMSKNLNASEIKYKNGTTSRESYLTDKQNELDAMAQLNSAIHDFNVTKAEFDNMINQ